MWGRSLHALRAATNGVAKVRGFRSLVPLRPRAPLTFARTSRLYSTGTRNAGAPKSFPGDWICGRCQNDNFAKRTSCRRCQAPKVTLGSETGVGGEFAYGSKGSTSRRQDTDWDCPACGVLNFGRRLVCFDCATPNPAPVAMAPVKTLRGDWTCDHCQTHNFARRKHCYGCGQPESEVGPELTDWQEGDWTCGSCLKHNLARFSSCRRCAAPKATERELAPDDWCCASCSTQQFAACRTCRRCGCSKIASLQMDMDATAS